MTHSNSWCKINKVFFIGKGWERRKDNRVRETEGNVWLREMVAKHLLQKLSFITILHIFKFFQVSVPGFLPKISDTVEHEGEQMLGDLCLAPNYILQQCQEHKDIFNDVLMVWILKFDS